MRWFCPMLLISSKTSEEQPKTWNPAPLLAHQQENFWRCDDGPCYSHPLLCPRNSWDTRLVIPTLPEGPRRPCSFLDRSAWEDRTREDVLDQTKLSSRVEVLKRQSLVFPTETGASLFWWSRGVGAIEAGLRRLVNIARILRKGWFPGSDSPC